MPIQFLGDFLHFVIILDPASFASLSSFIGCRHMLEFLPNYGLNQTIVEPNSEIHLAWFYVCYMAAVPVSFSGFL
jgi:hypothetical protein